MPGAPLPWPRFTHRPQVVGGEQVEQAALWLALWLCSTALLHLHLHLYLHLHPQQMLMLWRLLSSQ